MHLHSMHQIRMRMFVTLNLKCKTSNDHFKKSGFLNDEFKNVNFLKDWFKMAVFFFHHNNDERKESIFVCDVVRSDESFINLSI